MSELNVVGVVRKVLCAPDPLLATPSPAVDPTDPDTVRLAADLVATMRVSPGCVGLAAAQIGAGPGPNFWTCEAPPLDTT